MVSYTRIAQARGLALSDVKKMSLYEYYLVLEDIVNDYESRRKETSLE